MVITGLTRNQVARKGSWVRIPPSPPCFPSLVQRGECCTKNIRGVYMLSEETKQLLKRYFNAAANLYGMIRLYKLLEIYNSQNEPISEEDFLAFADEIDSEKEQFELVSDEEVFDGVLTTNPLSRWLAAEYLYALGDFDDFEKIFENTIGITYYVPNKKKFLKYEDEFYFEKTPEYIELRAFIRSMPDLSKERADSIAEEIEANLSLDLGEDEDENIEYAIANAMRLGLNVDGQERELYRLVFEFDKNLRKHVYAGHTHKEVLMMF